MAYNRRKYAKPCYCPADTFGRHTNRLCALIREMPDTRPDSLHMQSVHSNVSYHLQTKTNLKITSRDAYVHVPAHPQTRNARTKTAWNVDSQRVFRITRMENALRYYCTAIWPCGLCYHTSIRSSKYLHAKLWYHTVPFHTKQYHISESSLFWQCSQSSHLQTSSNCAILINRLESNQKQFKTKFKPMPHFHRTKFNQQRHQN